MFQAGDQVLVDMRTEGKIVDIDRSYVTVAFPNGVEMDYLGTTRLSHAPMSERSPIWKDRWSEILSLESVEAKNVIALLERVFDRVDTQRLTQVFGLFASQGHKFADLTEFQKIEAFLLNHPEKPDPETYVHLSREERMSVIASLAVFA